jgi:hypothetical protein
MWMDISGPVIYVDLSHFADFTLHGHKSGGGI